jgi:hypothetical protein
MTLRDLCELPRAVIWREVRQGLCLLFTLACIGMALHLPSVGGFLFDLMEMV